MIENWKDTAFGSDFGGDFLELIENIDDGDISIDLIYKNTDLKKYIDNPNLLEDRTDNNVNFTNSSFGQYIHFEDLIIALSAMIVESGVNGQVDLTKAYGSKIINFDFINEEIEPIYSALQTIYTTPHNYVLFEMCLKEDRKIILNDIKGILSEFEKIIK